MTTNFKKIKIELKDHNHLTFNRNNQYKKNKKKIVLKKTRLFLLNNLIFNYQIKIKILTI